MARKHRECRLYCGICLKIEKMENSTFAERNQLRRIVRIRIRIVYYPERRCTTCEPGQILDRPKESLLDLVIGNPMSTTSDPLGYRAAEQLQEMSR